jgi:hypothetical protein
MGIRQLYLLSAYPKNKSSNKIFLLLLFWLRSQGSNLGPSGYEPDELPLLYFAMQSYGGGRLIPNKFGRSFSPVG